MENNQMEDAFLNTGPPEASHDAEANQQDPLYSAGFVPNLQDHQTKEDHFVVYAILIFSMKISEIVQHLRILHSVSHKIHNWL